MIEKFDKKSFYVIQDGVDLVCLDYQDAIQLTSRHLERKYSTEPLLRGEITNFLQGFISSSSNEASRRQQELAEQCSDLNDPLLEFRKAIIVRDNTHSIFACYINKISEDGIGECVFYKDTLGLRQQHLGILLPKCKKSKINLYIVPTQSQVDWSSCHADTLTTAKQVCGRDSDSNEFLIPNLLSFLQNNSSQLTPLDYIYSVSKLPCRLLKTSQISIFNEKHHLEKCDYEKCAIKSNSNSLDYLCLKGLKLARRIEIEFYIKQLENILDPAIYNQVSQDFSSKAKAECDRLGYEDFQNKPGLYEFAVNYIKNCQINKSVKAIRNTN